MSTPNTVYATDEMVYANEVRQNLPIGQKVELTDGRIFHYALAGGSDLVACNLHSSSAEGGSDNNDTLAIAPAVALGDNHIHITNGASTWTLNELKGGSLVVERAAETGSHYYRIWGNTAEATGGATMQIDLVPGVEFDEILTTSAKVQIAPNPWSKVIIMGGTLSGIPVGVSMCLVTTTRYCYLQTHGIAAAAIDTAATPVLGERCTSGAAAGSIDGVTAASYPLVGISVTVQTADADIAAIFLTLG